MGYCLTHEIVVNELSVVSSISNIGRIFVSRVLLWFCRPLKRAPVAGTFVCMVHNSKIPGLKQPVGMFKSGV